MISDNLVTAHAHNVIILYGATVNINPVSAPEHHGSTAGNRLDENSIRLSLEH